MGRPSKLSAKQWQEIEKRLLAGESQGKLAREFGISRSVITGRFSARLSTIKDVANQLVSAEGALREMPVSDQLLTLNLADELRAISMHLASAAKYGSATAHRLNALAHTEVLKVDDAKPLDSLESLKSVGVLTKLANDSAAIGLNLLAANKDTVKQLAPPLPAPQRITVEVEDASMPEGA
jgi:hypothetical protein